MAQDMEEALVAYGYRPTRQRRAVYDCLATMKTHPTAEEVFFAVRGQLPNISLATVYKALESLATAGLAVRLGGGSGSARFDGRTDLHFHDRCRVCGLVSDLEGTPAVRHALEGMPLDGFVTERIQLEYEGVCAECHTTGRDRRPTGGALED